VAERSLGPRERRVVVGEDGAGACFAEEVSVDSSRAGDEAIGRRVLGQVLQVAAGALCGDGEAPVLDEGSGVDEVVDVLAGGAGTGGVAALDRVGARLVQSERPTPNQLV